LIATARKIATPGRGILAADESTNTIKSRFDKIQVENTEENRRSYRDLLISAEGIEKYISGVIFYEETLFQKSADGTDFVSILQSKGILSGIKVDKGVKNLRGTADETMTQGLDDLDVRAKKYYEKGARFAKWRAVLKLGKNGEDPSPVAIEENARGLARYAAICQDNGLVPIIEPEVLVLEGDHDLSASVRAMTRVFAATWKACQDANVLLEGCLMKPNMALAGRGSKNQPSAADVAHATVTVLRRTVPVAVPGIVFLSGGMSEEEASLNLSAINNVEGPKPWNLSFSYGRALQSTALKSWLGKKENVAAGQKSFMERAQANSEANLGKYKGGAGGAEASQSLYVSNYVY